MPGGPTKRQTNMIKNTRYKRFLYLTHLHTHMKTFEEAWLIDFRTHPLEKKYILYNIPK